MEEKLAKTKILSSFFLDHPESASLTLMKSDANQVAELIGHTPAESLITTLELLPLSLLEESLAKVKDSVVAKIIGHMPINLVGAIFHQWTLKKRVDNKRIEDISQMLDERFASSVKTLLRYPPNAIGSIMNPIPFSVRENLTAGEVLAILKKGKNRYCRYVYVVDENSCLDGVIPFKDVFYAEKDSLISTLMSSDIFYFHPEDTIKSSYNHLSWRKWDTIPVVDTEKYLVGLIRYETLDTQMTVEGKKFNDDDDEISQAGNAIGEVFQIGISGAISALILPLERSDKS